MNESIKLISHKPLEDYVTVLAIYDEPSPLSATFTNNSAEKHVFLRNINKKSRQSSTTSSQNFTGNCVKKPHTENEIVEITELNNPPTNGLQVLFDPKEKSETNAITLQKPANSMAHTRSISVDRISEQSTLSRNCARKSRFTDAFLDAKERLTQELERGASISAPGGSSSNYRHSKIVLSSDTKNMTIGVEVTGVPDPESPGRILAIEIIRIDEGGRISEDGRLRVGDQITAINGHLCKEMSLAKARRCLHDLDTLAEPSLAFNRQIQRHASETSSANANIRPVRSALQQANTSMIGVTTSVTIYKSKDGSFGFSFAGRMNAFGEHIYRVSRLMPNGASIGCLEIGDRLLKLDELDLAHCEQADVREYLKSKKSGEFITMTISRDAVSSATSSANRASLESEQQVPNESFSTKPRQLLQRRSDKSLTNLSHSSAVSAEKEGASMRSDYDEHNVERRTLDASELAAMEAHVIADGQELVELDVALNDSPSAGLGISLKAQKIYNDSETIDTGLYIRKLLHGSAAFKDGRLQVDDRLVAIENVNLLKFELNAKALEAFTNCLLQMPSTANYVRLIIARKTPNSTQNTFDARKKEFVKFNGNISDCVTDFINEVKDESESEASVVPDASEAFVRDIVTRKSISEKRPLGAHNDPSHLQTYQRIKHFRQTSAPALVCNGALLRSARTTIDSSDTGVAARVAEPLASEFLRPNRRRSVGTTNSAAVKRRLSFAPTAHNTQLVEAANAKRLITSTSLASSNASPIALARAKLLAQRRPFTVYCDSNNNCDDIANDFDNDDVKIQAEEFSPLSFESKTSPLKSKNGVDSFKKSSKFFNFFKLSGSSLKKMANTTTDDSKENEIDASPGRRSISVEPIEVDGPNYDSRANHLVRSFAGHTKSREQSAQKRNQNITSAVNSKISTSISQPTLATKAPSKDSENAKFHLRVKDDFTSNLEKLEKRNRRKSTGSGLLKLFQRSDTASLHLYAEDEKQAAKYYNIIEEKKRLDAVDDSFRHKYGLIDRNYGSPNMGRRAPPPSYHRIMTDEHDGKGVRDASRSYAVAPNFVSTPPMPPLHRRGHSEHVDIPTKHDAYINQKSINESILQYEKHRYVRTDEFPNTKATGIRVQPYYYSISQPYCYNLPPPPAYFLPPYGSTTTHHHNSNFSPKRLDLQGLITGNTIYASDYGRPNNAEFTANASTVRDNYYDSFNMWFANSESPSKHHYQHCEQRENGGKKATKNGSGISEFKLRRSQSSSAEYGEFRTRSMPTKSQHLSNVKSPLRGREQFEIGNNIAKNSAKSQLSKSKNNTTSQSNSTSYERQLSSFIPTGVIKRI